MPLFQVRQITPGEHFEVEGKLHVRIIFYFVAIKTEEFILYRVIKNDCRDFNNLSYTVHLG